jgi:hypothetical protein
MLVDGVHLTGEGNAFLAALLLQVGFPSVKVTGLAQNLGQLEAVSRDLQSKSWANLKLLGQPCNFYAPALAQIARPAPVCF